MSITERMKKYVMLCERSQLSPSHYEDFTMRADDILSDLQATMKALEATRELIFPICQFESGAEVSSSFDEPYAAKRARDAIKTIDSILGAVK